MTTKIRHNSPLTKSNVPNAKVDSNKYHGLNLFLSFIAPKNTAHMEKIIMGSLRFCVDHKIKEGQKQYKIELIFAILFEKISLAII